MAIKIFNRKNKKNREQIGKPIIKDTEVNKVSDISKVTVVDTKQSVSNIVPQGNIKEIVNKKSGSSNKKSTVLTQTGQSENIIVQKAQEEKNRRDEINKNLKTIELNKRQQEELRRLSQRSTQGTEVKIQTLEEKNRRDELNRNILTADTKILEDKSVKYEKSVNKIIDLSDKNEKIVKNIKDIDKKLDELSKYIDGNTFTGTESQFKEFNDYQKARNLEYNKYLENKGDYDIEVKRIQAMGGDITSEGLIKEPTIKIGVRGEREIPITKYRFSEETPIKNVGTSLDIVGESMFASLGKSTKNVLNAGGNLFNLKTTDKGDVILLPEKKTTTYLSRQGTLGYNQSPYLTSEITLPSTTSQDVSNIVYKGGTQVFSAGKYLTPYVGQTLFFGEVAEDVKLSGGVKQFVKNKPVETAIIGASLLTFGGLKAVKSFKSVRNKDIEKGLEKELDLLRNKQIISFTLVNENTGKVVMRGTRSTDKLTQEIQLLGDIKETEKGFKFIPSGKVSSVTTGIIKPQTILGIDNKPLAILRQQGLEFGSKGKGIFLRNIGDAQVFEEIGKSTLISRFDLFGISRLGSNKPLSIVKNLNKDITIDYQLPINRDRNFFIKLNEKIGLKASKREVGTVLTIPKKEEGVKILRGQRSKSSNDYFTSLYAEQRLSVPELSKVSDILTIKPVELKFEENLPRMVGGNKGATSLYAGQNTYERTEELGRINLPSIQNKVFVDVSPKVETKLIDKIIDLKVKHKDRIKEQFKEIVNLKADERLGFKELSNIKSDVLQVQSQGQAQSQVSVQRLAQALKTTTQFKTTEPSIRIPNIRLDLNLGKSNLKKLTETRSDLFKVFVTKKGKNVELGDEFKTLGEAKGKLLGELGSTLRASGFITKSGKPIKFEELNILDSEFKRSKVSPFKVVQVKTKRLKRGGKDVKEIQFFR